MHSYWIFQLSPAARAFSVYTIDGGVRIIDQVLTGSAGISSVLILFSGDQLIDLYFEIVQFLDSGARL
jgi:hypothetical protein